MGKIVLYIASTILVVFTLIIGATMWPSTTCSVEWLDSTLERIEGPFSECRKGLKEVRVGRSDFVQIGLDVFEVRHSVQSEAAGFPCMTGVTCFPIPQGRRTWKVDKYIRLDGPVELPKLRSYLDDSYVSDGKAVFAGFERAPAVEPPIDVARLHWVACVPFDEGAPCESYATDGTYVLRGETVIQGVDSKSFTDDLPALDLEGKHLRSSPFARDHTSVYAYGKKIPGADPVHFGVLAENGIIGFDRDHAWRDRVDEVEAYEIDSVELKRLRKTLDDSWSTRRTRK